jgi:outer membrane protein assembly factor BamB
MRTSQIVSCAVVLFGWALAARAQTAAADYTQWRGQNRDGSASAFAEPKVWPEALSQKWKVEVGQGYATPLVVGDRVYVFSRVGNDETMTALDAASGKVIWREGYPVAFDMNRAAARHGPGPKSTPVFANGRLFAIGMTGIVTAWNAADGKRVWQKPGSDLVPMYTTHAFSPVVDRGLVIFHLGGHDKGALTAFDVNTGAEKWSWPGDGPGYGSPIVADLGGTRQVITLTQAKLVGLDAATGALLWQHPFVSGNFTNSVTPILFGQTIIMSNGGPAVAVTVAKNGSQWTVAPAWENAETGFRLSNAVLVGDTLFGLGARNMGQYFAVEARSGKTLWISDPRQAGNAAIQKAGDVLFSLEDDGELVVSRTSKTMFDVLKRYRVAETDTWTQPAISGNRLFVKDVSTGALWTVN